MNLLLILLLLFSTVFHVHTSSAKKHSPTKPWQYNTRKVNRPSDDHKNCFCYPEGHSPTVHELLDPQDNGQERIVIYLYKNVGSNEIKMYTPNSDKQVLIPDIPYESGDGLVTVTTESVARLFYSNPYRIKIYNNRFEKFNPALADSLPIGLNQGAIEHVYPKDVNNFTPNNGYSEYNVDVLPYEENGNTVNGPQKGSIQVVPYNVVPNKWTSTEADYGNDNPEIIDQERWTSKIKYPNKNPQVFPDNLNPNSVADKLVYTFQTNDDLPSGSQSSSTEQDSINSLSERYITFTLWFNQQIKKFQNIHLPQDIKFIDNNVLKFLVLKTLAEKNIHVNADGVIKDSKGFVIDAANLELRPLFLGERVNYQLLQNSLKTIPFPKHLPYLEGILVTLAHPPQVLGIVPLGKTYLYKYSNLGESVSQPVTVNGSNYGTDNTALYSSATKIPETFVVKESFSSSNTGPATPYAYSNGYTEPISSKVFSNVYREPLSPSYSYSSVNKKPYSGAGETSYWSSGPYSTVTKEPYLSANSWDSLVNAQPLGDRRKLTDAKIEHHYEPPKTRKKGQGVLHKKSKKPKVNENTTPKQQTTLNTSESGRRFSLPSLKGVMKTLLYLLNDESSQKDKHRVNSTEGIDIFDESEGIHNGDGPDFRIIGGNAATGSGTPLNNKGRSGYEEYI